MSEKLVKVAIIGDPFVGKSSLIRCYFHREFSEVHIPEICDEETFEVKITQKTHEVKLYDTKKSTDVDYSSIDLIILCYSIENRMSLKNIKSKWMEELKQLPNWPIPFVLVASKVDLREEFPNTPFINSDDGENLSSEINAVKYFEVSSKDNVNVKQLIDYSIEILYPDEQKTEEILKTYQEIKRTNTQLEAGPQEQPKRVAKSSTCLCC